MTTATVGSRYQVVIPREVRRRIHIRPHSKVAMEISGNCVVIHPITAEGRRGLGRELADDGDATDYVRRLRAEWEKRS